MVLSYKNIINSGFFMKSKIFFYKNINFTIVIKNLKYYGLVDMILFLKLNNSQLNLRYFLDKYNFNLKLIRLYNIEFLKLSNIFFDLIFIYNLNILRLYFIKHYRGLCLFLKKPNKGQRTWSNSSTVKKLNILNNILNKKDSWSSF